VTRFGKFSHIEDQNFGRKDKEGKISTIKFHPASLDLEDRVSFDHIFNTYEPINIYTVGSKIDDRTGGVFYVRENNISTAKWMAQLKPRNSLFHDELIAIKEACPLSSQSNQPIKIWTDRESSLHPTSCLKTNSPLAQDIQNILLNSPNIKLGWIRAHVGHEGNETADLLAKKATLERIPTQYPAPRNFLKKKLHTISTQLCQNEWNNGDTGRSVSPHPTKSQDLPNSLENTRNQVRLIFPSPQKT
ncbi:Sodium-coupled monocarboxylate transporter 2, partial [Araneus ventricosus]